ncbi:MAG: hypothetical protein ABH846_04210, partial [Patescibacteria group bacterium]
MIIAEMSDDSPSKKLAANMALDNLRKAQELEERAVKREKARQGFTYWLFSLIAGPDPHSSPAKCRSSANVVRGQARRYLELAGIEHS